ncbi:SMI1/KNR4 family protein [Candidatus Pantoea multigeneris]|uniref:SMI1/KNR4 family protein n=1 Tax=Candidatus Pantoea multigeneris TaxID=2608357 RepID=A0ABX0RGF3_9GAMM|nr:SMI1/KNR4 family protein [Pantoea multigeneris]NIF24412.1 SMI1/KNR4 family protein [Pantoea multigeneris]
MSLTLEGSEENITLDDIRKFEMSNNVELPTNFIDFYLINNGGYSPEKYEPNPFLLGGFFSFSHGKVPIEKRYKELLEDWPNLLGLIPFAYDDGGNLFLISTVSDSYGEIKIWITDESELGNVSMSFLSFINEMKKDYLFIP